VIPVFLFKPPLRAVIAACPSPVFVGVATGFVFIAQALAKWFAEQNPESFIIPRKRRKSHVV